MNAKEFLARLEQLLADLPPEERRAALEYYTEYLQDACPQEEDNVSVLLGTPEAVAAEIRLNRTAETDTGWSAGYTGGNGATYGDFLDDAPETPQPVIPAAPATDVNNTDSTKTAADAADANTAAENVAGTPAYQKKTGSSWLPWVLLALFTCPLWIGLVGALLGILVFAVVIPIVVVIAAAALVIGGLVAVVAAAPLLATAFGTGILTMGVALLAAAAGCILLGLLFWLAAAVLPLVFRLLSRFFGWLKGKVTAS